jgi:hypothetical protein
VPDPQRAKRGDRLWRLIAAEVPVLPIGALFQVETGVAVKGHDGGAVPQDGPLALATKVLRVGAARCAHGAINVFPERAPESERFFEDGTRSGVGASSGQQVINEARETLFVHGVLLKRINKNQYTP